MGWRPPTLPEVCHQSAWAEAAPGATAEPPSAPSRWAARQADLLPCLVVAEISKELCELQRAARLNAARDHNVEVADPTNRELRQLVAEIFRCGGVVAQPHPANHGASEALQHSRPLLLEAHHAGLRGHGDGGERLFGLGARLGRL